jgi:hypothetical protein
MALIVAVEIASVQARFTRPLPVRIYRCSGVGKVRNPVALGNFTQVSLPPITGEG